MLYQVVLCTEAISEMYVTQIPLIRKHCEPTIHLQSDIKIIQYIYIYYLYAHLKCAQMLVLRIVLAALVSWSALGALRLGGLAGRTEGSFVETVHVSKERAGLGLVARSSK